MKLAKSLIWPVGLGAAILPTMTVPTLAAVTDEDSFVYKTLSI